MINSKLEFNWTFIPVIMGIIAFGNIEIQAQSLAFPGAEGYGKYATGGRGGEVVYVSNLNPDGPGSFKQAVEQEGPRIVVFEVAGTIKLDEPLQIFNGDLTIAGQTAPGDGITIRDYTVDIEADNVIIRFMRFRLGDKTQFEGDALNGNEIRNVIIDHCSMSWSIDETATFYRNENFTLQWSIISESLNNSYHSKGHHGYGGIWGGRKASFHHNLLAHHTSRNPRFADSDPYDNPTNKKLDFYNNVIYNWGYNSIYGGELGEHNMVNNYFKPGPATSPRVDDRIVEPSEPYGKFYVHGNFVEGSPEVSEDNWKGGVQEVRKKVVYSGESFDFNPGSLQEPSEAFKAVLKSAGASYVRDTVDKRIIRETRTGTTTFKGSKTQLPGIIDSQEEVGGWPELESAKAPADTDGDGMPDSWEKKKSLDPEDASDSGEFTLSEDYTNIEVYLNSLVYHIVNQIQNTAQDE